MAKFRRWLKRRRAYFKRRFKRSAAPGLRYNSKVICTAVNGVNSNSNGIIAGFTNLGTLLNNSDLFGKIKNAYSMFRISFIKVTVGFSGVSADYQGNSLWVALFPGVKSTTKNEQEILGANNCGEFVPNCGVKKKCVQRFLKGGANYGYGLPMSLGAFTAEPALLTGQLNYASGKMSSSGVNGIAQVIVDFYVELYGSLV